MRTTGEILNKRNAGKIAVGIVFLTAFAGIMLLQMSVMATAPPGGPPVNNLDNDTDPDPLSLPDPGNLAPIVTKLVNPSFSGTRG